MFNDHNDWLLRYHLAFKDSPSTPEVSDTIDISALKVDTNLDPIDHEIDLGEVIGSGTKEHSITLSNSGVDSKTLSISLISSPGYSIKLNRCGNVLASKKSCQIIVTYSSRNSFNNIYPGTLRLTSSQNVALTATVSGKPDPDATGVADLQLSLNAPFLPKTAQGYRVLTIENIGSGTAKSLLAQIPSGYSIRLNRCPVDLKPGYSCKMEVLQKNFRSDPPAAQEISVSATNVPPKVIPTQAIEPTQTPLVFVIDTTYGNVNKIHSMTLYFKDDPTVSTASIDWGDGVIEQVSESNQSSSLVNVSHTYANSNTEYTVKISSDSVNAFPNISSLDHKLRVTKVLSWGTLPYSQVGNPISLQKCTNLSLVPSSIPPQVTSLNLMFESAINFNQDISTWDVSNITDMSYLFNRASKFNQDLSTWNTANVTNMDATFYDAYRFNQNIPWNTSQVTTMRYMFQGAAFFNQDISTWNTSKVKSMRYMFSGAESFNQNLSLWNVSEVTDMLGMFINATIFNQNLSNWNTGNVLSMDGMFLGASSFNQDISSWCVQGISTKPFNFDVNAHPSWRNQSALQPFGVEACQ